MYVYVSHVYSPSVGHKMVSVFPGTGIVSCHVGAGSMEKQPMLLNK